MKLLEKNFGLDNGPRKYRFNLFRENVIEKYKNCEIQK